MSARDFMMLSIAFAGLVCIGGMVWLASWLDRREGAREPDWSAPPSHDIAYGDIVGMGEAPRERA
jgi:hypothetical protein